MTYGITIQNIYTKTKYYTDIGKTSTHSQVVNIVQDIVGDAGLNVLVNNAGVGGKSVRLSGVKETDLLETFAINTVVPVMLTKVYIVIFV